MTGWEPWTTWSLGLLFLLTATLAWASSVFSLPGNWVAVLLALLYGWAEGFSAIAWWVVAAGAAAAALGELAEWATGFLGAKQGGGNWVTGLAALGGSMVGALVGAAFAWGLGAIPGTILGAFAGALLAQSVRLRHAGKALKAGLGAAVGRALGLTAKLALGGAFLALLWVRVLWALLQRGG
jgi:uncharacterized protein YqgC (DUF456 family)